MNLPDWSETVLLRASQDPLFRQALAAEAKACPELAALTGRVVAVDDQEQQRVGREDQEPHAQPAKPA